MNARAFFISLLFFSLGLFASDSDDLRLSGRVFPEVEVNLAPVSVNSESSLSNYRIRSNMGLGTYRVFFEVPGQNIKNRSKAKFRRLVVEAK